MFLANGLSKFPIKRSPVFSNGPKGLPKNLRDSPILCNWVFISADELFAKVLQNFELENYRKYYNALTVLCEKSISFVLILLLLVHIPSS